MSTDDIFKKLTTIKEILNGQYGVLLAAVVSLWLLGKLNPEEFDQAVKFLGYINNDIGLALVVLAILVFVNATFFKPYLEKEKTYITAVKDFEGSVVGEMGKVAEGLNLLLSKIDHHEAESDRLNRIVEIKIIPAVDKLLTLVNKRNGDPI